METKIMNTIATISAKPPSHPLDSFYKQAKNTNPQAHKGPIHAFFQSPLTDYFNQFSYLQQPDPTGPPRLHQPSTYSSYSTKTKR